MRIIFFDNFSELFFSKIFNHAFTIYRNESFETSKLLRRTYWKKYSNNIHKNRILMIKNGLLESPKDFKELNDRELKDKKWKTNKGIRELFFKPITAFIDNMGKFGQKEIIKNRRLQKRLVR